MTKPLHKADTSENAFKGLEPEKPKIVMELDGIGFNKAEITEIVRAIIENDRLSYLHHAEDMNAKGYPLKHIKEEIMALLISGTPPDWDNVDKGLPLNYVY